MHKSKEKTEKHKKQKTLLEINQLRSMSLLNIISHDGQPLWSRHEDK